MELYKSNPDIAQSYWHCIRSFKEGCGYVMEEIYNVLIFATRDPKMQALTGKLYNDWAHERYLERRSSVRLLHTAKVCNRSPRLKRMVMSL